MTKINLIGLGWNDELERQFESYHRERLIPGRVSLEHKHIYRVMTEKGELLAEVSGKLRFGARGRVDYPAVGDWVAVSEMQGDARGIIHGILPRFSKFARKMAGSESDEQIVAANVDTVFLVNALNQDFNVRRLERYLLLTWESGATPVVILSKADLCEDIGEKIAQTQAVAFGIPIHVIAALKSEGLEQLAPYVMEGKTVALLGSSGSGKSTLTNALLGREQLKVSGIREDDDKGRHTTTHREMVVLPGGGILIDTPGMRELQLTSSEDGLQDAFEDIEAIGRECQFGDCTHRNEPGCAVEEALHSGRLDRSRFESFKKLQKELAHMKLKEAQRARMMEKRGSKTKKNGMGTQRHKQREFERF